MREKDLITVWRPVEDLPEQMFVEALYDDYEGFRILLRGEKPDSKMLRVAFEDRLSYRNADETYLSKFWFSTPKETFRSNFFTVENSSYIDYFEEMSEGLHPSNWVIIHYAIYTQRDCIDILSYVPPNIEWLS